MQFDVWTREVAALEADCLVLGIFEEGELTDEARAMDTACGGKLRALLTRGDFSGRANETLLVTDIAAPKTSRVLLVGLGQQKNFNRRAWRKAYAAAVTALGKTRIATIGVALPRLKEVDDYYFGRAIAEITTSALYRINDLKTGKKPRPPALERVVAGPVRAAGVKATQRGFVHGQAIANAMTFQRNLGNLPSNICTPSYLADQARALGRKYSSIKVQVLDEAAIRREKMGCFLAVTRGSEEPPRFLVLDYKGPKAPKAPIVLVGKGITFDTGGISLKDPGGMDEMKFDMCGAAAVLAAMGLVAELKLPIRVVGLVATCENMPSGRALKPGDIITSAAGLTVEVLNTDAEGRLILSDALHYARRFDPEVVVDVATLTGACVVALGAHHTGVMSNDDELAQELVACGLRADDRAWQLPLTEEYGEQLKSNFADFANVGGREGGAITAAAFLGKFTQGLKWAHLDIAGTAWHTGANKGGSGRPMGLLGEFLLSRAKVAGKA